MLDSFLELLKTLYNAERLIQFLSSVMTTWIGYAIIAGVVFSETGLLLGFFLPGDSFLFTVGVVAGAADLNIAAIIGLLIIAAITGNGVGYSLGRAAGPHVFNKPDSRLFKRDHLLKTQAFYEKHGGKTIIYAQFMPILRTFAPFIAGVARMPYTRFATFNVVGAILWITSMTLLGYGLGNIEIVRKHFEKVVILIVLISITPLLLEILKSRRAAVQPSAGD
ncbi:MAG TPA: VTT domain-containing protein [Bryobacteraceae bacterium]|nr:VTT domain-containing protein [Bryobacteraceae bacterium]